MSGNDYQNPGKKWFPRVDHLTGPVETIGDEQTDTYISCNHQMPYIGDFPPKDDYRKGIYD